MEKTEKESFNEVITWLEKEFFGIRTGQATPAILDSVKVEGYGSMMPLNQVGSIGIEDAKTLVISVWDASLTAEVEKAVTAADLGVSVSSDSSGIRVSFPELTSERRVQLEKLVKSKYESARVSVRSIRDELMKKLDKAKKDGEISEDEMHTKKDVVQKTVDEINKKLESLHAAKLTELAK